VVEGRFEIEGKQPRSVLGEGGNGGEVLVGNGGGVEHGLVQSIEVHHKATLALAVDHEPGVYKKIGGRRSRSEDAGREIGTELALGPGEISGVRAEVRASGY